MTRLAVILNDTRTQLHHGCEVVMSNLIQNLEDRGISVSGISIEGRDWSSNHGFLAAMRRANFVIVNGEGTIHHGRPAAWDLVKVASHAKSLGIPSFLINCTYQQNPLHYKNHLEMFSGIYVREHLSQKELDNLDVKCRLVPDLTLAASPMSTASNRRGIGITDSTFVELSKRMLTAAIHNEWEFLPVLRAHRFEKAIVPIELLRLMKFKVYRALYGGPVNAGRVDSDYLLQRNNYIRISTRAYIESIMGKQLIVTARFHAMCFCLLTETPFLALKSNSHKIESMLADIGLDSERMVDEQILDGPINPLAYAFSSQEIGKLRSYVQTARQEITNMFDSIAAY
jgi:polysaccharide pyruvyl transferase WcaK-like protein